MLPQKILTYVVAEQCVNEDLKHIYSWLDQYGLTSNQKKTEVMVIGSRYSVAKARDLHVELNGEILKQSDHFRYLGVDIDSCLTWKKHVSNSSARMYPKLKILNRISAFLGCKTLLKIYKQTILPALDYGCMAWAECGVILYFVNGVYITFSDLIFVQKK